MWGLAYILSAGAGVSFVIQQAANANLRSEIESAWWASTIAMALCIVGMGATLCM